MLLKSRRRRNRPCTASLVICSYLLFAVHSGTVVVFFILPSVTRYNLGIYLTVLFTNRVKKLDVYFYPGGKKVWLGVCPSFMCPGYTGQNKKHDQCDGLLAYLCRLSVHLSVCVGKSGTYRCVGSEEKMTVTHVRLQNICIHSK